MTDAYDERVELDERDECDDFLEWPEIDPSAVSLFMMTEECAQC